MLVVSIVPVCLVDKLCMTPTFASVTGECNLAKIMRFATAKRKLNIKSGKTNLCNCRPRNLWNLKK